MTSLFVTWPVQNPGNAPYAHWTWYQAVAGAKPNYDCTLAYKAYAYAGYTGDTSSAQIRDPASYQVGGLGAGSCMLRTAA